jgi:SNF2 family DNA or RNA helicase/uncharacterized Zn finger protein
MIKYGLTWWGQKWLNSLTHIDYNNRLPRGSAYAGRGAVKSISFKKNIIEARVQGSRPTPYKIKITVPLFTPDEKKIMMNIIKSNNYILTKLLNRELPEELFELANSNKIKIFPDTWRSIGMYCSCPDGAVPCKHLAAVIYLIANEIDMNPFMAFLLHDFDILDELSNDNLSVSKQSEESITSIDSLYIKDNDVLGNKFNYNTFQSIDFTTITDIREDLLSLLKPNPIFYLKDFKEIIASMYKTCNKEIRFDVIRNIKSDKNPINTDSDIKLVFSNDFKLTEIYVNLNSNTSPIDSINELKIYLNSLELKNITNYSDQIIALYLINLFVKRLIEMSAYIPQLIKINQDSYFVRWIPATINQDIKNIFDKLLSIIPGKITGFVIHEKKEVNLYSQTPEEQLITLCSVFLNDFVTNNIDVNKFPYQGIVLDLFFKNKAVKFNEFSTKQIPNTIQIWLNKYHISLKKYAPIIKVEEDQNGFKVNILIENRTDALLKPVDLHKFISDDNFKEYKYNILKDLTQLSEQFSDLKELINSGKNSSLKYSTEQFIEILLKVLPVIKLFGLKILLPKSLKELVHPKLSLNVKSKKSKESSNFFTLDSMLDFDWKIALGDEMLSVEEFQKLVKNMSGLIKYKEKYYLIQNSEIEKLFKNLQHPPTLSGTELFKIALTNEYDNAKAFLSEEVIEAIRDLLKSDDVEIPLTLTANLRPYQIVGYEWLYKNSKLGFGSLMADDMGLGKTIQVITALLKFKQEGFFAKKQSLVVVPTTLLTNWVNEIERFAPDLSVSVYHGSKREFPKDKVDIILTTYGTVRNDIEKLKKLHLHSLIIDEAQNIKNPDTEQTKVIKQIKADIKIAMSGTPVENRLSEYWSIFDFVNKGYLGSLKKFNDEFVVPIKQYNDTHKLEKFKKITQPFIMRRLKSDKSIIQDLPDKIENNQYCSLSKEQTAIYQKTVDETMKAVLGADGIERKGLVLKLMTSLKQICNHPNHYLKKANPDPNISGKMSLLFNIIENILESNEKTLIFTQYKEMGDLLVESIKNHFNVDTLFLYGGISRNKRDELVKKFQESRGHKIFILSLKAGGTGLNLTAASNVIHYDLWWNPAVEAQATDRAYRIGQKKNVMVYRLLTKGTLEEKIDLMLNSKKELANLTVTSGEQWIGDLSDNQLKDLVKLSQ